MKYVKLFENWEDDVIIPEAEELMDKGEDTGSDEEMADDTEEVDTEEDTEEEEAPADDNASWESLKGDILDKYKNGEMTKDEAISALG
jgi:hypothetical protein